jgi:glucose-6-phosphate 1-dehydrogenase
MTNEPNEQMVLLPTAMILLGATGDLAQKRLLPALMDLYVYGSLPEQFHLVAFSREARTNDEYRAFVREHICAKGKKYNQSDLDAFLSQITYVQGLFEDKEAFARIKKVLDTNDERIGMCSSKLFYLAVPPVFYEQIFEQIAGVNLEQTCVVGDGWTRILVEKPFGSDLESSKHLEEKLCELFNEKQVYRIDHYLAKDALQNILAFRFSNVLFEERWCKEYVEGIYIQVAEKQDVVSRGAFFDGVGALRDVGQNHILQMLTLITMDRPDTLTTENLRTARAKLLESLHIPQEKELDTTAVKGQYNGYREVPNVLPKSKTETYFALKAFIDSKKWKGVPIYFEHGKALKKNAVQITVRFRSSEHCVCGEIEAHEHPNFVTFDISPEQKISVQFWVRKPGLHYELEKQTLTFDRNSTRTPDMNSFDAYEEVLFNALSGDQTLFVSGAEQEASWGYITAILRYFKDKEPIPYAKGSTGPKSTIQQEIQTLFT